MQKIAFYLFLLSFITACQVVKLPKQPLTSEQVALAYFLDTLAPNDPHLKGREFEFDFVVRQGIGSWQETSYARPSRWQSIAAYEVEDSTFKYLQKGKDNFISSTPLRLKRIRKTKKIKYENTSDFFYNYFVIPRGVDTSNVDFLKVDGGIIYLGSQYTELPNGSFYTMSRLQVIYVCDKVIYNKSYYFILRNDVIKYLSSYITNHREDYKEGKNTYLITP